MPSPRRVAQLISSETRIAISTLARLETIGHLHGRIEEGLLSRRLGANLLRQFDRMLETEPYEVLACPRA